MSRASRREILVADDDEEYLTFLRSALSEEPYQLVLARNGVEALELAARRRPGLVLLDIGMPLLDGYEVCRRLKTDPRTRDIPVVVVTARTEEQDILKGFQAGADDFLSKPFSIAHLKAKIRTWISRGSPVEPP